MSIFAHWKTKRELKRYQQHLSDKLQIEAEQYSTLKKETDRLKDENENLRLKIGAGKSGETLESLERELEVLARAESSMMVHAPGFAGAWENAKGAAHEEILAEERGKSLPRRLFRKFFPGSGGENGKAGPARIAMAAGADDHEIHENGSSASYDEHDGENSESEPQAKAAHAD